MISFEEIKQTIEDFEKREDMNEEEKKKFETMMLVLGVIFNCSYNDKKEDSLQ